MPIEAIYPMGWHHPIQLSYHLLFPQLLDVFI